MKKFTSTNLSTVRQDIKNALEAISTKHGIEFNLDAIRFDSAEFSVKLTSKIKGSMSASDKIAAAEGVKIGKTFRHESLGACKVVGYNLKAKRYPVKITTLSGKAYKIPTDEYLRMI